MDEEVESEIWTGVTRFDKKLFHIWIVRRMHKKHCKNLIMAESKPLEGFWCIMGWQMTDDQRLTCRDYSFT